ncbi:MAG: IPT/TIG domain-containing protein [Actinomycetota bacterium]
MSHRVKRRRSVWAVGSVAVVMSLIGWAAIPAHADVVTNPNLITFAGEGESTPYPSTLTFTLAGLVTDVNVKLHGLTHDLPADIDILLVGPGGQGVVLMADTGSGFSLTGVDLTFDDEAASSLPGATAITAGSYKPTNLGSFSGSATGSSGNALSVFDGASPNGTWRLFVFDDNNNATHGSISGGWSLDITRIAFGSVTPPSGRAGDIVTIAGSGFTGASAVKFGGVPAVAFTVDSDTQITATVPVGAGSGPVSVTSSNVSVSVSSSTDFVVMHARAISIELKGHKALGTVDVSDGFAACGSIVPVKVQHLEHGHWKAVAGAVTKHDGSYKALGLDDPGKYRAVARKTTLSSGDVCLKHISPTARA